MLVMKCSYGSFFLNVVLVVTADSDGVRNENSAMEIIFSFK